MRVSTAARNAGRFSLVRMPDFHTGSRRVRVSPAARNAGRFSLPRDRLYFRIDPQILAADPEFLQGLFLRQQPAFEGLDDIGR